MSLFWPTSYVLWMCEWHTISFRKIPGLENREVHIGPLQQAVHLWWCSSKIFPLFLTQSEPWQRQLVEWIRSRRPTNFCPGSPPRRRNARKFTSHPRRKGRYHLGGVAAPKSTLRPFRTASSFASPHPDKVFNSISALS